MAEIKVEPKRGGLGWLWAIILLVVAGVLVWYFMTQRAAPTTTVPADSTRTSTIELPMHRAALAVSHISQAAEATSHG
jgi:hypothetical protein